MGKSFISGLVLVFVLMANARAAMTLDWTITPNAATADPSVGGGSLDLIVGTLTSDSGHIQAVDAGNEDNPSFTGQFYQDWSGGNRTMIATYNSWGEWVPSPEIDTHFLFDHNIVDFIGIVLPSEDGNPPFSFGTYLGGGITTYSLFQLSMDFVQFYVPSGTCVSYDFKAISYQDYYFQGTVCAPEPGILCLLGFGCLTMLLIRRR